MLRKGQRFTLNGQTWRVAYVNFSRAHCVSESSRPVTVYDAKKGASRTFVATETRTLDISPDSQLDILKEFQC